MRAWVSGVLTGVALAYVAHVSLTYGQVTILALASLVLAGKNWLDKILEN